MTKLKGEFKLHQALSANRIDNTDIFKHNNTYREYRRTDSLAKFLVGSSICAAITLEIEEMEANCSQKKEEEEAEQPIDNKYNLLVSSNKITKEDALSLTKLYESEDFSPEVPWIPVDQEHQTQLKKSLDILYTESLRTNYTWDSFEFITERLCNITLKRYRSQDATKDALDKFIPNPEKSTTILNSGQIKNEDIINFLKGKFAQKSLNYKLYYKLTNKAEQKVIETKAIWKENSISDTQEFFKHLNHAHNQVKKIGQILHSELFSNLKSAIKDHNFKIIEPHAKMLDKDAHSEMNIAVYLLNNKKSGTYYIGNNKLNCFDCKNDITIINDAPNLSIKIITRGAHNVQYSDRRIAPNLDIIPNVSLHRAQSEKKDKHSAVVIRDNDQTAHLVSQKIFVEHRKEMTLIHKQKEYADYSDSDEELAGYIKDEKGQVINDVHDESFKLGTFHLSV